MPLNVKISTKRELSQDNDSSHYCVAKLSGDNCFFRISSTEKRYKIMVFGGGAGGEGGCGLNWGLLVLEAGFKKAFCQAGRVTAPEEAVGKGERTERRGELFPDRDAFCGQPVGRGSPPVPQSTAAPSGKPTRAPRRRERSCWQQSTVAEARGARGGSAPRRLFLLLLLPPAGRGGRR